MPGCCALIVAAGRGTRFGGPPKQYQALAGEPLLRHCLRDLASHQGIESIIAVIHRDDREAFENARGCINVAMVVEGGETRQDSVRNGLEKLVELQPETVLIHDAARPRVVPEVIDRLLDALRDAVGAIPVLPVTDTLKRLDGAVLSGTVDRAGIARAQTPQAFRYPDILAAHRAAAGAALTDDAAVMAMAGGAVLAVEGSPLMEKITTMEDLRQAEALMAQPEVRTGIGFDAHRLGEGSSITLCGLNFPHGQRLLGHSDADVALHAVTDAVLGALAEGDIGAHFPPSDPRWAGASSDRFLLHAMEIAARRGAVLLNCDLTIICEEPRIGPRRDAMRANLARLLGVAVERVSIKGKTTERMGFTGRGEGIAAQAVVSLRLGPRT